MFLDGFFFLCKIVVDGVCKLIKGRGRKSRGGGGSDTALAGTHGALCAAPVSAEVAEDLQEPGVLEDARQRLCKRLRVRRRPLGPRNAVLVLPLEHEVREAREAWGWAAAEAAAFGVI